MAAMTQLAVKPVQGTAADTADPADIALKIQWTLYLNYAIMMTQKDIVSTSDSMCAKAHESMGVNLTLIGRINEN